MVQLLLFFKNKFFNFLVDHNSKIPTTCINSLSLLLVFPSNKPNNPIINSIIRWLTKYMLSKKRKLNHLLR